MKITKTQNKSALTFALEGRLDTTTSPELEKELKASIDGIDDLTFDFSALEYISSAGLRVILAAQKIMNTQGKMKVCGANADIMEVFDITGFTDILTIEK
ncbi:MAG: STAS domain-containing protein [Clostridia bacterium]|nr:STAS domain-containing protein [Clostridia bacterium]